MTIIRAWISALTLFLLLFSLSSLVHANDPLYGSQNQARLACEAAFHTAPYNNWGNCYNAVVFQNYRYTRYWHDNCPPGSFPNCVPVREWRHNGNGHDACSIYPYSSDCRTFYFHWQHSCPVGTTPDADGRCLCANGAYAEYDGNCPSCIEPGDCPSKNAGSGCPSGGSNPINISVANKVQVEVDYQGQGNFPLHVTRTYNSMTGKWRFFPNIVRTDNPGRVRMVRASGEEFLIHADGNDGWHADPDRPGTLTPIRHSSGELLGWKYVTLDGDTEQYSFAGNLTKVTNLAGISHTYSYSTLAIKVTHSNGQFVTYNRSSFGRINGFTTPDGQVFDYIYSGTSHTPKDRLAGVNYPGNTGSRIYHYEKSGFPNALTGITDANGNRYATWTYDSQGRANSSRHNNGADNIAIDYTHLNNTTDPRTTVTNALGKQTTYRFTTRHDVRKVIAVEGHPSTYCAAASQYYSYDANGFVASETDWNGNTTTYTRNAKGQELTRTEAAGTPQERVITTQWHAVFNLPISITEPGRATTYTYDHKGNQLNRVVVDTAP